MATNGSSDTLFGNARVQLRMAPQVLSAWNEGGKKGVNIKSTGHPYIQEVVSQNGSLDNIVTQTQRHRPRQTECELQDRPSFRKQSGKAYHTPTPEGQKWKCYRRRNF